MVTILHGLKSLYNTLLFFSRLNSSELCLENYIYGSIFEENLKIKI